MFHCSRPVSPSVQQPVASPSRRRVSPLKRHETRTVAVEIRNSRGERLRTDVVNDFSRHHLPDDLRRAEMENREQPLGAELYPIPDTDDESGGGDTE